MPFCQRVSWQLTFVETPPPETDSYTDEEEDFPTVEFYDPVWSEELIPDRQPTVYPPGATMTDHTPRPAAQLPQLIQEVELPDEQMDITIPYDLLDIIDVPEEELYSVFDSLSQSVLK